MSFLGANIVQKMGSASSSRSRVTVLKTKNNTAGSESSCGTHQQGQVLNEDMVLLQAKYDQTAKLLKKAETEIKELQSSVSSLTVSKNQLHEELDRLVEELDGLKEPATRCHEAERCVEEKDKMIKSLQQEIQSLTDNMNAMKQKYKARLKTVRENSGKKRQDISLQVFELKDEISRLTSENEDLQSQLLSADGHSAFTAERQAKGDTNKAEVIIELSTQISDQEYRISTLESELAEKDAMITKLLASQPNSKSVIELEAEQAAKELRQISKEIQKAKLKKKRQKAVADIKSADPFDEVLALCREDSALSKDSGNGDMRSSRQSHASRVDDSFSLIATPTSFSTSHDGCTFAST